MVKNLHFFCWSVYRGWISCKGMYILRDQLQNLKFALGAQHTRRLPHNLINKIFTTQIDQLPTLTKPMQQFSRHTVTNWMYLLYSWEMNYSKVTFGWWQQFVQTIPAGKWQPLQLTSLSSNKGKWYWLFYYSLFFEPPATPPWRFHRYEYVCHKLSIAKFNKSGLNRLQESTNVQVYHRGQMARYTDLLLL